MTFLREPIQIPSGNSFRLLRWRNNLMEIEQVISPMRNIRIGGEGSHWHYHQALELTLFTSGTGTRFVGDRIQPFSGGDLVLLGENLPHYWHTSSASTGISLQWRFPPVHPFWAFPECEYLGPYFRAAARGVHYSGRTAEVLSEKMHQLTELEGVDRLGLFFRILSISASAPATDQSFISANSFSLSAETRHQTAMQSAIRFVLIHFREQFSLRQLLKETRMSKPTFSRQFKKHCGKTLSDFVQQVRLDAVCHELVETDHPIIDVALANGFSQISFFNKVFRRAMKCSPSDFRNQAKLIESA